MCWASKRRIFVEFDIGESIKFNFDYSRASIWGTLHGDVSRNIVALSYALLWCVSVTSCALFILRTAICVRQQYLENALSFHGNSGNANAPQCYVIRTLHIFFNKIQQDATVCRYLFTAKSLYMFRVSIAPIIRCT